MPGAARTAAHDAGPLLASSRAPLPCFSALPLRGALKSPLRSKTGKKGGEKSCRRGQAAGGQPVANVWSCVEIAKRSEGLRLEELSLVPSFPRVSCEAKETKEGKGTDDDTGLCWARWTIGKEKETRKRLGRKVRQLAASQPWRTKDRKIPFIYPPSSPSCHIRSQCRRLITSETESRRGQIRKE